MDRHELAWAAGFFDGEGWAAGETRPGRRRAQPRAQINQAAPHGVPEVLERFQRAVGCGQIYGPKREPGRIDLYSWVASSRPNVARAWEALGPYLGPVKSVQFSAALSLPLRPVDQMTTQVLLAWAAGFWDGEGSIYLRPHRTHVGYWIGEAAITQEAVSGGLVELRRFASTIGCGRVYGPYEQEHANGPIYRWKAHSLVDLRRTVDALRPGISLVKRAQIAAVMKVLDAQAPLPRGNPAWGYHKTHCVHGHEYALMRIRPYRPRGRGRGPKRSQCLVCVRLHADRKRHEKKLSGPSEPPNIGELARRYLLK